MNDQTIIEMLKQKQGKGTQKELADAIGVSAAYLSDIYKGNRKPAEKILRFLGIKKEFVYRRRSA